jgi:hydrogenase maturation protease
MATSPEPKKPATSATSRVTILGVGNVLLTDEGVGVRAIERLGDEYRFPANVEVYDGGTGGMGLLSVVEAADYLIVVDAVLCGAPPGTVVRFPAEDLPEGLTRKVSAHEVDILEVLRVAELLGKRPPTLIVGIQPRDISTTGTELSDDGYATRLAAAVIEELAGLGIEAAPKEMAR